MSGEKMSSDQSRHLRRHLLQSFIVVGTTAGLAGCSDQSSEPQEPSESTNGGEVDDTSGSTNGDEVDDTAGNNDGSNPNGENGVESESPRFELTNLSTPNILLKGEQALITVTIQNYGNQVGEATLEASLSHHQQSESVTIESGKTQDIELAFSTEGITETTSVSVTETTSDDTISGEFDIVSPDFDLSFNIPDVLISGTEEVVEVTVENLVPVNVSTTLMFALSNYDQSQDIVLEPNATETVTFEYTVPSSTGSQEVRVTETASNTGINQELTIANLNDVYDVELERHGFECYSSDRTVQSLDWDLLVSTDIEPRQDGNLLLKVEFLDNAGYLVGAADVPGAPPSPDTPAVWGVDRLYLDNDGCSPGGTPCCSYAVRIAESLDEGGSVRVADAQFE